ncbi:MAG: hypothetical protein AABP62_23235 [Planctomycetota bacterium]
MHPFPRHPWRVALFLLVIAAITDPTRGLAQNAKKPADLALESKKLADEKVSKAFAKADRNSDRQLTREEFLADRVPAEAAKRDFLLFDLDGDEALSLEEFSTLPTVAEPEFRGPLPDPMQVLVDQVMSALDKSLNNWKENPKVEVDAQAFITAFSKRFEKYTPQLADREADPDGNGKVTRDEARRFLEIQFGVRRGDGKLLRLPNGRVVNYMLYLHVDLNKNDKLERAEFIERSYGDPAHVDKEFDEVNANGDDSLSFEEWCRVKGRAVVDPIMEFSQMDTNFDAFVDLPELVAGTPESKHKITASVFPGFDLNRDGKLSLPEYRLTMQANMVLPWQTILTDSNGDGTLSFTEFKFDPMLFPLLRTVYFLRLDANSSGTLDPKEFSFTLKVPNEFFVMNSDGTGWRSLFLFEGHPSCGSPAVSSDGKLIAFDAVPLKQQQQQASAIFVMSIDGGNPRQIASGMMPTWSMDGQKLACSRSAPVYGVWLMDLEGDDHKHVGSGWGAQLSPDGTKIAFTEGTALKTYDIETETIQTILDGETNPYRQIYWNSTWAPDGKRFCLRGVKADGTWEVATVNMTGDKPELKVHHSGKVGMNDPAWHPQGDRIVFAMTCPERSRMQLYEFNPNKNGPPTLLKGQDETRHNKGSCWTPDGKRLIIVSGDY